MTAVSLLPRNGARNEGHQRSAFERQEASAALCLISLRPHWPTSSALNENSVGDDEEMDSPESLRSPILDRSPITLTIISLRAIGYF